MEKNIIPLFIKFHSKFQRIGLKIKRKKEKIKEKDTFV